MQRKNEEINLVEENEPIKSATSLTGLSSEVAKRIAPSRQVDPNRQSDPNRQVDSTVNNAESVQAWLASVKPAGLSAGQLDGVYLQMMRLFRQQEVVMSDVREFRKELIKLPDYWQLVDRTKHLIKQLATVTLINLLRWFSMIGEDQQSPLFLDTCNELHNRAHRCQLSLAELAEALFVMHFHIDQPLADRTLLRATRNLVLDGKTLDHQNVETLTKCLFIFLMPDYDERYEATKRLIAMLTDAQLDFRQSVMLLRRVKQSHHLKSEEIRKNYNEKNFRKYSLDGRLQVRPKKKSDVVGHFPNELSVLIDKCNTVIHHQLTQQPTNESFDYFLSRLHDFVDALNHEFNDFYPVNLLEPIRNFLLSRDEVDDGRAYDLVRYNLVMNYYKLFKFDEQLLRRVYETVCTSEELRNEVDVTGLYYVISKYRFPFVNHELLATKLFNDMAKNKNEEFLANASRLLAEFILNDVQNEALLSQACDGIHNMSSYHVSSNEYKKLALARVYFSMFGKLRNRQLKEKIARKLNTIIYDYAGNKPKLSTKYSMYGDSKLQKNGFLSNGMYVKGFAVYDPTENDLISLADHEQNFFKIDRIPTKQQEL